ncbi:hypothetical protein E6P70_10175 [Moraxella nonliquefaciens]|uniref:hypothetical protein n=2 Tax=Moraxella nonliquefaciens TaxID=478 RepID=UPI0024AE1406|nr:hypothetical protein [Moraxella nonliquefaciens]MDI4500947.1 hypothetical protein [Moraxella nonliquefaciens]
MKNLFFIICILLLFLILITYLYMKEKQMYKEELNAYYPEVVLVETFEDNFYKSYDINIQGLFYSKHSEFGMPIFIANKLDDVYGSTIGYNGLYENELYMHGIDVEKYKLNYNDKNQGLELFYFKIVFDIKNNQDLKYKNFLNEIINNRKAKVFRYQKKDIMGGTIYVSDPFIINFNDEQINNLNAIYNEIF